MKNNYFKVFSLINVTFSENNYYTAEYIQKAWKLYKRNAAQSTFLK